MFAINIKAPVFYTKARNFAPPLSLRNSGHNHLLTLVNWNNINSGQFVLLFRAQKTKVLSKLNDSQCTIAALPPQRSVQ